MCNQQFKMKELMEIAENLAIDNQGKALMNIVTGGENVKCSPELEQYAQFIIDGYRIGELVARLKAIMKERQNLTESDIDFTKIMSMVVGRLGITEISETAKNDTIDDLSEYLTKCMNNAYISGYLRAIKDSN